jgi:4'-phosphopantetheinyl transferase
VEIWATPLHPPAEALAAFWSFLDIQERARAERFHFRKDRDAFVAARGSLRALLGSYLEQPPRSIAFGYGPQGKPFLERSKGSPPVQFNLSHSDGLGLVVIGRQEIGVDVERVRSLTDLLELADRFFSRQEVADLRAVPAGQRAGAFFRCWTAKEAYIKARGEGLSMPLDRFAVSLTPPAGRVTLAVSDSPEEADRWSLHRFEPAADYVAAVAVEGECRITEMRWIGAGGPSEGDEP